MESLKSLDLFPKTLEDFRVRTLSGGFVSIASFLFVGLLLFAEFGSYMSTTVDNELVVDSVRDTQMVIHVDITFPRLACSYMSLDVVDIAGETQLDVESSIMKQRLDRRGNNISTAEAAQLEAEAVRNVEKVNVPQNLNGCDSCYGAESEKFRCCTTCADVREAYREKGWAFNTASSIAQCANEGFTEKMASQRNEGCRVYGTINVEKVAGNFHVSPGRSFQSMHSHVHDTAAVDHNQGNFNLTHTIGKLAFGDEFPGSSQPLDGLHRIAEHGNSLTQYFVKVVPTTYTDLSGQTIVSNQYSVTQHYQGIDNTASNHEAHGQPGVFFMYDLSPIQVNYIERSKSFASFLTGICAIIGGAFTISSLVDSFIYHGIKSIQEKARMGKAH